MHTTPTGGLVPADSGFRVRYGDEPVLGRLPLHQEWAAPEGSPLLPELSFTAPDLLRSRFVVVAHGSEREIRALNERALAEGQRAVRSAHGDAVRFGEPRIHTYVDPQRRLPMEPLMFVKVNARREHLDAVLQDLRGRGARMQEVEVQSRRVIVRAEVRLAALLGFDEAVQALSGRTAQVFAWLVRYEAADAAQGE